MKWPEDSLKDLGGLMNKLFYLTFLLVGCGTATAQPLPEIPVTTGSEEVVAPEVVTPEVPTAEDTMPVLLSPPDGGERIIPLAAGASAPFPGVLLNSEAAAWLEVEPDAMRERAQLFLDRRLSEVRLELGAEIQRLQLRVDTMSEVRTIELAARQAQIDSLLRVNESLQNQSGSWWEQGLFIGGALIVGVALGIIIALVAN